MALTDQDLVDVRRHMGYGALGNQTSPSLMYWRFMPEYVTLEFRLANVSDDEIAIIQDTYLPILNKLETDIAGSADNLDTLQAAVWHWNPSEIADRTELYNYYRKVLCGFLQLPPGPFFVANAGSGMRFHV